MIDPRKLDQLKARRSELEALMAEGPDGDTFAKLSKEYSDLTPIVAGIDAYRALAGTVEECETILADPESDADMKELAQDELIAAKAALPDAERALQLLLLPKDAADDKNALIEIRAGTGGDEAALFAGDLLRMYTRHAEVVGWKAEVIEASETDLGGYKEVVLQVSGAGVFAKLKFESGGHRVQRVPTTEAGGRIHTSAATVAVMPEAEEVDLKIADKDLRIDTYRSQGAGGQHVNTTDSAVRITHLPTGLAVAMQEEKSQHKNKDKAMKLLRSRLYERERQRLADERAADRKEQIGSGDRSDRVRTYNFPQNRLTDHRINLTLYNLDKVVTGEALSEVLDALVAEDQAARLAELGEA